MITEKKNNRNWVFWLFLFVLFCIAVYVLRSVLLPFVAGIIIGYLLDPWTSKFEKWGMNRTFATFLVMFLVLIFMIPALIILIGIIDEQLGQFLAELPRYITSLVKKMEPVFIELQDHFPSLQPEKIREYLKNNMTNNAKTTKTPTTTKKTKTKKQPTKLPSPVKSWQEFSLTFDSPSYTIEKKGPTGHGKEAFPWTLLSPAASPATAPSGFPGDATRPTPGAWP